MEIIVVGCGRAGAELAYRLFVRGHKVVVIDRTAKAFGNLPPEFRGRFLEGDALNQDVLKRAGIENARGLATVTNSDTINVVVAHIAKKVYGVPHVVARNYDPHRSNLYEIFDLQVVSSISWGAQRIEEMLAHPEFRTVYSAGSGEVEVYEFYVPAAWEGQTANELFPHRNCVLVGLTRGGRSMLADPTTTLHTGDLVLVSTTAEGIEELQRRLSQPQEA